MLVLLFDVGGFRCGWHRWFVVSFLVVDGVIHVAGLLDVDVIDVGGVPLTLRMCGRT